MEGPNRGDHACRRPCASRPRYFPAPCPRRRPHHHSPGVARDCKLPQRACGRLGRGGRSGRRFVSKLRLEPLPLVPPSLVSFPSRHLCAGVPMSRTPGGGSGSSGWVAVVALSIRDHQIMFSFDGGEPRRVPALLPMISGDHVVPVAELAASATLHDRGAPPAPVSDQHACAHASAPPFCSGMFDGYAKRTCCRHRLPARRPHGPFGDATCRLARQASRASRWGQQRCVVCLGPGASNFARHHAQSYPPPPLTAAGSGTAITCYPDGRSISIHSSPPADSKPAIAKAPDDAIFTADRVFGSSADNAAVSQYFDGLTLAVLNGRKVLIVAYGQVRGADVAWRGCLSFG